MSSRPEGRPLDVLINKEDVMSSPFKGHPDSVARRIEVQQLEDSMRHLRELADQPDEDDGPDWLDITLDSSQEEVEAALPASVARACTSP